MLILSKNFFFLCKNWCVHCKCDMKHGYFMLVWVKDHFVGKNQRFHLSSILKHYVVWSILYSLCLVLYDMIWNREILCSFWVKNHFLYILTCSGTSIQPHVLVSSMSLSTLFSFLSLLCDSEFLLCVNDGGMYIYVKVWLGFYLCLGVTRLRFYGYGL